MTEPGSPASTEHTPAMRAHTLSIAVEPAGDTVVLDVSGEIDALTADRLGDAIDEVLPQQQSVIVVDMTCVDFLAAAGLEVLLRAHHEALRRGHQLRVVAPEQETFRPLHATAIDNEIAVYFTRQRALSTSNRAL